MCAAGLPRLDIPERQVPVIEGGDRLAVRADRRRGRLVLSSHSRLAQRFLKLETEWIAEMQTAVRRPDGGGCAGGSGNDRCGSPGRVEDGLLEPAEDGIPHVNSVVRSRLGRADR